MATLIVLQGPDKGKTLNADDDVISIGRGAGSIPLGDQTVSRKHAEMRRLNGDWVLMDLNSANGTYLNGMRLLQPVKIKRGDQIRVGSTLLVYTGDDRPAQLSGASIPRDMVRLDAGSASVDASIVAIAPSNEDSIVLAAPETANAVKAWNVLRELSDVIGSLLPPDRLLTRVMDIIFDQVDVERGVIFLRNRDGEVRPQVVRFRDGQTPANPDQKLVASRAIIDHVMNSREGVLSSNVVADKRFGGGRSMANDGLGSVVCAPIVARDQVLGAIHLECPVSQHTYNENELKLITAIGYQAGLAIDNARLVQSHLQQERLAAAGETVAYLSHYIKNILQGMRSGADVLQAGLDKQDLARAAQGWQIVERNLEKTYHLVMNMLAFSKQREPFLEMYQINRIVEEVIALVQRQADDAHAILMTELDENLPAIPVDHEGIHQVVLNLLTNAIDAVPPGKGAITVRTAFDAERREVIISVTDNGPGIAPEHRSKIFTPFHSTKGHGGTGLGLAVARKIVREMHGRLILVQPPDGGTEFRVTLPELQPSTRGVADTHGPGGT
ncbi:MAG: FHA domain-containing protein [Phycisphaerae bacterium]|nr:FHA domain-containing protein [Phycisphaerae bacterium]HOO16272.1 ATP-binding protein [Phycisphaerae bacterium]HPC22697.1 ATP-binding protein [Phycisphaerae bacterium]HRS29242.1 ATP-binding protein [Phycisphaerae bacterium]HRT41731.1 ATP-binding protein [Phycisphaerae bacterium]